MLGSIKSAKRIVLLMILTGMLGFFTFTGGENFSGSTYLGSPPEVSALPCFDVEHYYYDDATYSNQVGWRMVTCSGVHTFGTVTQWVVSYQGGCCGRCCGGCEEYCLME